MSGALPPGGYMIGIDPIEQRRMMQGSLQAILALFLAAPTERIDRHSDWFVLLEAQLHIRPYRLVLPGNPHGRNDFAVWTAATSVSRVSAFDDLADPEGHCKILVTP